MRTNPQFCNCNISALVIATTVVISIIVGFTIYFNNPGLNQAWSVQQQQQQQKNKGLIVVSNVHSPELKLEKNYDNVKSSAQTGINRPVTEAGMIEENHTMTTTIKL